MIFFFAVGLALVVLSLIDIMGEGAIISGEDNTLSHHFTDIITGIAMMVIATVFWLRRLHNRKEEKSGEDDA